MSRPISHGKREVKVTSSITQERTTLDPQSCQGSSPSVALRREGIFEGRPANVADMIAPDVQLLEHGRDL